MWPVGRYLAKDPPRSSVFQDFVSRSRRAISPWSKDVIPSFLTVKRRCRPSGRAHGQRWDTPPFETSGTVRVSSAPPCSLTSIRPAFAAGEKTIPLSVHAAPFVAPTLRFSVTRVGGPPASETL